MRGRGVDVEQLMGEVNKAVAAPETLLADFWRQEENRAPNLAFVYPPYSRTLAVNLDLVSRNWEIDSEFELGSQRRIIGGPVTAFKRAVRAALRWYINPIVHQVRRFNMLVTRTLNDLVNNIEELTGHVSKLEAACSADRLKAIEERLDRVERGESSDAP